MQQELFVEFKNTASQFIYLVVDNVCVKGFMDTEEVEHFLGVYLETGKQYEIYWFVWDRDGLRSIQDWEPVLLVYREDGTPAYCAVRPHFSWDEVPFDDLELSNDGCVMVLFAGSHHGPVLKTKNEIRYFEQQLRKAVEIKAPHNRISREKVPKEARNPPLPILRFSLVDVDKKIEELIQSL